MRMPGLVVPAEIGFLDAPPGIYANARRRREPAHHRFVGQHGDGPNVLVWHGHDGELVAHKALVLQDDAHVRDAHEAGTNPYAVVDRIDYFALQETCPDLLELLGLVVNDVAQSFAFPRQSRRGTPLASLLKYSAPARIIMPSTRPQRPTNPNVKMPSTTVRTSWMTPIVV